MSSTELLSSKVVILEEEPSIPAISAIPSAILLCLGITKMGPIADKTLVTSFDEYSRVYGGFTLDSQVAIAAHSFFGQGGSFMWISRTCHFTDVTDRTTFIATIASGMLKNSGSAASPAVVGPSPQVEPFAMDNGDHLDIDIGSGTVASTFTGATATLLDTATYPVTPLTGGETLSVTVDGANGGREQAITAVGGETTAIDIANLFNGSLDGAKSIVSGGQVQLVTDKKGTAAGIQITTEGTLNAILSFPTSKIQGTGNVANLVQITALEVEAVVEAAHASSVDVVVGGTGSITVKTVADGATANIQVQGTSTFDFGLDTDLHEGADATPEDTLAIEGKTPGSYGDLISIKTEDATSGKSSEFNFKVLVDGAVKETFPNVTMDATDPAAANYIENRVNNENYGSALIKVTDQMLVLDADGKRPVNATSANLVGGDDGLTGLADSDYIGNEAGPTGLYCFDDIRSGRILIIPGVYTPAVHKAMLDYAEMYRNGSMFCVLDSPPQLTAQQVNTYVVTTASLLEYSEFGAIYWPWLKISNPQPSVFGSDSAITIPPSGVIAGRYASNDKVTGGIYESPAGTGGGFGILRGVLGVEDDPRGGSVHEVEDERKRDLIYPNRINPITRLPGTPWHIDGGRTLKSTGNFPNVGERRGVIFIEQTVAESMIIFKHRFNNKTTRNQVGRIIKIFLIREMNKGAFRSTNANEAFFVDVSDQLNPVANEFAGILTVRIGLATNKPNEFIVVLVTQDTRALEESLVA